MINIFKFLKLAKVRGKSSPDYLEFQAYQAKFVLEDVEKVFSNLNKDSEVIDFGCGKWGYTTILKDKFNKTIGIDYYVEPGINKEYLKKADILKYKHKNPVDLIFCSSVIEHVKDYKGLIDNFSLNLKKGGYLYLSFPPFYSVTGGHQLKPYHFLGEKLALKIGKKLGKIDNKVTGYDNLWGTWGLYKRGEKQIAECLKEKWFEIIKVKTRYFPFNLGSIPLIGTFFNWHIEFYCVKN